MLEKLDHSIVIATYDGKETHLAYVCTQGLGDTCRDTGKLIAAAPDLLHSCKQLLQKIALEAPDRISAQDEVCLNARLAIFTAEKGQP